MALKVLMLRKKKDGLQKQLDALRAKQAGFEAREKELEEAINELTEESSEEERAAVTEAVDAFEAERTATETEAADLEKEIADIESEIDEEEAKQGGDPELEPTPEPTPEPGSKEERTKGGLHMVRSKVFRGMPEHEVRTMIESENVKAFLSEVRTAISEKRAITNAGLLIPDEFLALIRENIENYSKLYDSTRVVTLNGKGRQPIAGTIPEAVWTECCANLNELALGFNEVDVDCWKVGGFFAICDATLEDADIDLAGEIITAIGQAIGYALDKAILFGLGTRMPQGVVTRLAQTSEPADYPDTYRTWVDFHTKNILKTNKTGVELFKWLVETSAITSNKYARGEMVWAMNDKTYKKLLAEGLSINAAGAIVSGVDGSMPILGGKVVVLNFIADYDIVFGYFDLYLLGERRGIKLSQSEHVKFLQDQTVFKGTARYDGIPVIAEAFGLININNTNPTTVYSFAPDSANASE